MNIDLLSAPTTAHEFVLSGPASARITLDHREYINFGGSAYLALGRERQLREAAFRAIEDGAAFSCQLPSVYGFVNQAIRDLEITAAAYCGTEDAVYLASGYLIGAVALTSIDTSDAVLFIDEHAHFNLFDAARLTTQPVVPFRHCDPEALAHAIRKALPAQMRPIVISDGVFGTTGRVAPLEQYAAVLTSYNGRLVVDEAHGFGVLGAHGRGAADHCRVESIATTAATLSKAFCAQGAIIGCSREVADKLRRVAPLRGANQGSPISAAVATASIRYMQAHPERRTRLAELTSCLRNKFKGIGIEVEESPAPILAFRTGDRAVMCSIQSRLLDRGIYIMHSNYIGAGAEGIIRCAVFADHSEVDLDALVDGLASLLPHLRDA